MKRIISIWTKLGNSQKERIVDILEMSIISFIFIGVLFYGLK